MSQSAWLTIGVVVGMLLFSILGQAESPAFPSFRNALVVIDNEKVPLQDGRFTQKVGRWTEEYSLTKHVAYGDLNGDGKADAATIVVYNGGGSGSFYYLLALCEEAGQPRPITSELLGDRIEISGIAIANRRVVLDLTVRGKDDPLCCPSQKTKHFYQLRSGPRLIRTY